MQDIIKLYVDYIQDIYNILYVYIGYNPSVTKVRSPAAGYPAAGAGPARPK